jgi:hypothetical protein
MSTKLTRQEIEKEEQRSEALRLKKLKDKALKEGKEIKK